MEKDSIYGKRRGNLWNEFFEAERLWEQNTEARQRWPEEVGDSIPETWGEGRR